MAAGSTYGNIFKFMTWGESHGEGLGVVVDGCPAGISLCEEDIQKFLNRRKPGQSKYTTPRKEDDKVSVLSGVFEGKTTGTPISMVVYNKTQRSADYSEIAGYYRPGHADYTFDEKYGFRDYRGGGRSSGRETIGRVAAGAIAVKILEELGINVCAYSSRIGGINIDYNNFDLKERDNNAFNMPDSNAAMQVEKYADEKLKEQDSMGGIIECVVTGMMAGVGDPVFEKLDANLAKAIMSIGAVMMMSERKELMYMFIEELANEDVAAVINDTNRGRIRKLEARIEYLEALLAKKDETIAKKDKQIKELEQKKQALIERENLTP